MPFLMLRDLPRYECLLEAAKQVPELNPAATEVYLHLMRTGDEVLRLMNAHYTSHQVSQGRFTVLMLLFNPATACGLARTPAALADMANVTRATMTGLIDTLERDGLARREPDPTDRRMMSVQLTPKGEAFMRQILPPYFRCIAELMSDLTPAECKSLVSALNKIVARATTLAERTTAGSPCASDALSADTSAPPAAS